MTSNQPPEPVNEKDPGAPAGGQPPQEQPYPPQPQPYLPPQEQAYPPQQEPYLPPQQPYPPQQYPAQPAQPYPAQPYQGQPYAAQPYPGQQPYETQQPYEAQQPYQGQQPYSPAAQQPYPPQGQQPYAPQGQVPQGAYPPAGAAYSAGPENYPQAPGPYPQAPGAYPSAPGPYPPGPNQPPYAPTAYQPVPGQAKPKGKGPLILGITGGVAVLAVGAAFLMPRAPVVPLTPVPTASATAVVQTATAESAESAVQGYLEALAKGDATTALAYAATPPADASMLTNEVLIGGLRLAPIADITVAKGSGGSSSDTIEASYTLGGVPVSASFPATKVGSEWRLQRIVANVDLSALHPDLISLRLNGVPIASDSFAVFPGGYSISPEDARYALTATNFRVKSPDDSPDTFSMALKLSVKGQSQVRSAAQKKLNSCLKQRSLKPAGCGFSTYLPGSNKPRNSTIRWKVTKGANAMKKVKPLVVASDPRVAQGPINVQLRVDLRSTNGRVWYGFSGIYAVTAVLSDSGIKVTLG